MDSIQGAHQDGSMAETMVVSPLERGAVSSHQSMGRKAANSTDDIGIYEEALLAVLMEG